MRDGGAIVTGPDQTRRALAKFRFKGVAQNKRLKKSGKELNTSCTGLNNYNVVMVLARKEMDDLRTVTSALFDRTNYSGLL